MYVLEVHDASNQRRSRGQELDAQMARDGFDVGMVVRSEMMELDEEIEDLNRAMNALRSDNEAQLELARQAAEAEVKRHSQRFRNSEKELQNEIAMLRESLAEKAASGSGGISKFQKEAEAKRLELERTFGAKLAEKEGRLKQLQEQRDDMAITFEERMEQSEERHTGELQQFDLTMADAKEEHQVVLTKAADDSLMMKLAFDEHLRQMESEYEREVEELQDKQRHERIRLTENVEKVKSELVTLEKKMAEDLRMRSRDVSDNEMLKLQTTELRRDLEHEKRSNQLLRQDVAERNHKLSDKETRIVDLKNDIRGLEKLKFLQDHQMMAMKEEIEPLNQELARMRDHQGKVDAALENDMRERQKDNRARDLLQLKITATETELKHAKVTITKRERFVALFSQDLERIVHSLDPSEWQQPVHALFRKYVEGQTKGDEIDEIESALETQAREWGRQRDFSERRLKAWKHKSQLVDDKSKYLNNKRVAENSALIVECNDLRMVNRELKLKIHQLTGMLKEAKTETLAAKRASFVNSGAVPMGVGDQRGGGSVRDHAPSSAGSERPSTVGRPGTAGSVSSTATGRSGGTMSSNVFTYASRPTSGSVLGAQGVMKGDNRPGSGESGRPGTANAERLAMLNEAESLEDIQLLNSLGPSPESAQHQRNRPSSGSSDRGVAGGAGAAAPSMGKLYKGRTGLRPKSAGPMPIVAGGMLPEMEKGGPQMGHPRPMSGGVDRARSRQRPISGGTVR